MKHPVAEASEKSPFGTLTPEEFYAKHGVSHSSEFITNLRGIRLFTQWWAPISTPPIGCVAVVHGFTGESSWLVQLTAVLFASCGFAVCAIDHQGHGFSSGLLYHIPDLSPVVDDCRNFFADFRRKHAAGLPSFLYSESLGGAIALFLTLRDPRAWDGIVLNGAMCGISDKFKPPWPLENLLGIAAVVIPTWCVVPTRGSIPEVSFKEERKRQLATASPRRVVMRPRAATAKELLRVCAELQGRFEEVDAPMLIVHGGDDVICDPECARELHARASSVDKTLKIYPGMWHQLIGEPDDSVDLVFGDIVNWLTARAKTAVAVE